ncbi:MAG: class I lanthipeptide [Candidatus Delongbacteria bacterium]
MKTNLSLNKETVAKLNGNEMLEVKGGDTKTPTDGPSCFIWQTCVTVCINTCADTCVCSAGTGMCC